MEWAKLSFNVITATAIAAQYGFSQPNHNAKQIAITIESEALIASLVDAMNIKIT